MNIILFGRKTFQDLKNLDQVKYMLSTNYRVSVQKSITSENKVNQFEYEIHIKERKCKIKTLFYGKIGKFSSK